MEQQKAPDHIVMVEITNRPDLGTESLPNLAAAFGIAVSDLQDDYLVPLHGNGHAAPPTSFVVVATPDAAAAMKEKAPDDVTLWNDIRLAPFTP